MSSSKTSTSGGADPWAWLGLLKWSLAYSDGTSTEAPAPMSAEDKAFLEKVMKEGIINENERMKEILVQVTDLMEQWKKEGTYTNEQEENAQELLQELRDIVEQIDFARAFAAMKGLDFLLGCIEEREAMPRTTRLLCLGLISTLCQNNPPVQQQFLALGSIRLLSDLFFQENNETRESSDSDGQLRAKIIQAISATVRSHEVGEAVFCQLDQAVPLLEQGLGMNTGSDSIIIPTVIQKRALFFLRALLTSDTSSRDRVRAFQSAVCWVADNLVMTAGDETASVEVREDSLELIQGILEQKKSVNAVLSRKDTLVGAGVKRVAVIRRLTGDDFEFAGRELVLWESVIALLARTEPDALVQATPPMLEAGSENKKPIVPQ